MQTEKPTPWHYRQLWLSCWCGQPNLELTLQESVRWKQAFSKPLKESPALHNVFGAPRQTPPKTPEYGSVTSQTQPWDQRCVNTQVLPVSYCHEFVHFTQPLLQFCWISVESIHWWQNLGGLKFLLDSRQSILQHVVVAKAMMPAPFSIQVSLVKAKYTW